MERTPIALWGPYAYLVGASDRWGSIYHLMNETPAGTPAKTVYIQYTLGYQPGANATNSRPVEPLFLDITGCGNSTYDVPGNGGPGSVYTKSRDRRGAGRRVSRCSRACHLHKGGHRHLPLKDTVPELAGPAVGTAYLSPETPLYHLAAINPCVLHEKVDRRPQLLGDRVATTTRSPGRDVMGIELAYVWWGTQ